MFQHPIKINSLLRTGLTVCCLLSINAHTSAATPATPATPATLEEINLIAETGAIDLSVRILEREQPLLKTQPTQWMAWERQRIQFYKSRKQWLHIAERLAVLPDFVDVDFIFWAKTERASALIALRKGGKARRELRGLIWRVNTKSLSTDSITQKKITLEKITEWRRLIIESYLVDGRAGDAQMASIRLQQDLETTELNDILVRARIAILNNQPDEAIRLLKPLVDKTEAASLMLLAQLRAQERSPKRVMQSALRYIESKDTKDGLKANLWAVVAEAAQRQGNRGITTKAIEHLLIDKKNLTLPKSIYHVDTDALWNAYIDYALSIGNEEQLLIGEDSKWLDAANRIRESKPVGSRAMSVFVMLRGQSSELREQASAMFVTSLSAMESGNNLLIELFKTSRHFPETQSIPKPVRHTLVDIALTSSDIDRASELMATIAEPPAGSDQFMWSLRRARILVLGNQAEVGSQALTNLLDKSKELDQDQIDKLLQVVFDLQTAGKHEQAYGLFVKVLAKTKDKKIQREIYYWMADSRKSQERYADAAQLYLKSAMHPDPENMDPWAQTAHYQAAESLARAGLYDDARILFKRLLRVTEDPTRRATLKRELHRLWAMQ